MEFHGKWQEGVATQKAQYKGWKEGKEDFMQNLEEFIMQLFMAMYAGK